MRFVLPLIALLIAGPASAQQATSSSQPISETDARLLVAPYAFGTPTIDRSVADQAEARYEVWTTRFNFETRIFHIVLRENRAHSVVADDLDIEAMVSSTWPSNFADIEFDDPTTETVQSGLGTASYRRFAATDEGVIGADGQPVGEPRSTACVGFILPFGGTQGGFPVNTIQGLYCDPAELVLPTFDIEGTLQAIGVKGLYQP